MKPMGVEVVRQAGPSGHDGSSASLSASEGTWPGESPDPVLF